MQSAQLEWLPGILSRQGETSVCTRGFLVVSHIGVVCPDVAIYPGCKHPAENDVNDEAMVAAGGMAGSSMDEDVSKQSKTDVHDRNGEGKYLSKSKKHGGHLPPVVNDELWGTDKSSTLHCMEIRKVRAARTPDWLPIGHFRRVALQSTQHVFDLPPSHMAR